MGKFTHAGGRHGLRGGLCLIRVSGRWQWLYGRLYVEARIGVSM